MGRARRIPWDEKITDALGSNPATIAAAVAILLWALTGPLFGFSDTWQLVINTTTTIVTFLMVFIIQRTQNRDSRAIHAKLDDIVRAIPEANDALRGIEHKTERPKELDDE